jgi:D-amino-acid oxidase
VRAWGRRTYRRLNELALGEPAAGVTMVDGIELFPEEAAVRPHWSDIVEGFRPAAPSELPAGAGSGWCFRVPTVAMGDYLAWLTDRLQEVGAGFEEDEVSDLAALFPHAPVVVNCSGLGARELAADEALVPVRGQVVRVAAGHARRFVQAASAPGGLAYIIPRGDLTVLGGTTDAGAWDTRVRPEVSAAILERCRSLEPALAGAEVLSHAVGLRPYRPAIRLAAERRPGGLLVHNYGHGGAGVSVSWGCAAEVARLVRAAEGC